MKLAVRYGRARDIRPLRQLVKRSSLLPGWDYVSEVLDKWLLDPDGKLFTATADGKRVGLAHVHMITRNVAWLEGARVHPDYRGVGIATLMANRIIQFARAKGARRARLATSTANLPSQRHLVRAKFRPVTLFRLYQKTVARKPQRPRASLIEVKHVRTAWNFIKSSEFFRLSRKLYCTRWVWRDLTLKEMRGLAQENRVVSVGGLAGKALAVRNVQDGEAEVGFLDGTERGVRTLLRRVESGLGGKKVRFWVPQESRTARLLETAGYKKRVDMIVYERRIR